MPGGSAKLISTDGPEARSDYVHDRFAPPIAGIDTGESILKPAEKGYGAVMNGSDFSDDEKAEDGTVLSAREIHTDRGFDRLVNFTDAVVAIAITLLILPVMDTVTEEVDDIPSVAQFLNENSDQYLAFLITFMTMFWYWFSHHRIFERLDEYDFKLILLAFCWLIGMVFLAFPIALVFHTPDTEGGLLLLFGTLGWLASTTATICFYVRTQPSLLNDRLDLEESRRFFKSMGLLYLVGGLWASVIAVTTVPFGWKATLAWVPYLILVKVIRSRTARRHAQRASGPW